MLLNILIPTIESDETYFLDCYKRFEVVAQQRAIAFDVRRINLCGPLLTGGVSPTNMVLVDLELPCRDNSRRRVARLRTDYFGDGLEMALTKWDAPVVDERSARYLLGSYRVLAPRDFSLKKYVVRGVLDEARAREYVRRKLKKHFSVE
jgi:hypothetical protein